MYNRTPCFTTLGPGYLNLLIKSMHYYNSSHTNLLLPFVVMKLVLVVDLNQLTGSTAALKGPMNTRIFVSID